MIKRARSPSLDSFHEPKRILTVDGDCVSVNSGADKLNIYCLPPEIIEHIFSFVIPDVYNMNSVVVTQLSGVCKDWNEYVKKYIIFLKPMHKLIEITEEFLQSAQKNNLKSKTSDEIYHYLSSIKKYVKCINECPSKLFDHLHVIYEFIHLMEGFNKFISAPRRGKKNGARGTLIKAEKLTKEKIKEFATSSGIYYCGTTILVNKRLLKEGYFLSETIKFALANQLSVNCMKVIFKYIPRNINIRTLASQQYANKFINHPERTNLLRLLTQEKYSLSTDGLKFFLRIKENEVDFDEVMTWLLNNGFCRFSILEYLCKDKNDLFKEKFKSVAEKYFFNLLTGLNVGSSNYEQEFKKIECELYLFWEIAKNNKELQTLFDEKYKFLEMEKSFFKRCFCEPEWDDKYLVILISRIFVRNLLLWDGSFRAILLTKTQEFVNKCINIQKELAEKYFFNLLTGLKVDSSNYEQEFKKIECNLCLFWLIAKNNNELQTLFDEKYKFLEMEESFFKKCLSEAKTNDKFLEVLISRMFARKLSLSNNSFRAILLTKTREFVIKSIIIEKNLQETMHL